MNKYIAIVIASTFFLLGSVVFLVSGNTRIEREESTSEDTITVVDDKNTYVGTYIPDRNYKVHHRLTIDTKDGTVTQLRMSVILDQ